MIHRVLITYAIARLLGNFVNPVPIPGGGDVQAENIIERFIAEGYTPAELWALSHLGQDGLNNFRDFVGSSIGHSHTANTPDLGAFIKAVLDYTGAEKVDIVAHSLGVTLVRNWIRQELDRGVDILSRLDDVVLVAGANHGSHFCGFPFVNNLRE
ncbi:MAG: alpha/beta hydrolase [Acidobacteria bacterium]|nr:alpha/beta hydrolase [Acidobacteriota bacterium]